MERDAASRLLVDALAAMDDATPPLLLTHLPTELIFEVALLVSPFRALRQVVRFDRRLVACVRLQRWSRRQRLRRRPRSICVGDRVLVRPSGGTKTRYATAAAKVSDGWKLRTLVGELGGERWKTIAERLGTGRTAIAVEEKWKKLKAAATTAPPPLLVGGRPHKRPKVPKQVVVGARVVWMKYGYEGVVEAEVTPGVFRVLFDKGGFRDSLRAEELRVL